MCIGIGRQVNSIGFSPLPAALVSRGNAAVFQSPLRFASRRSMNSANAIPPKRNTHSTTNIAMLLVGVGTLSTSQGTIINYLRPLRSTH